MAMGMEMAMGSSRPNEDRLSLPRGAYPGAQLDPCVDGNPDPRLVKPEVDPSRQELSWGWRSTGDGWQKDR